MKNLTSISSLVIGPVLVAVVVLYGCDAGVDGGSSGDMNTDHQPIELVEQYAPFRLTTDLGQLTDNQRAMIPLLVEAAGHMDDVFWMQAYGDKDGLLSSLSDASLRQFARINYGPWDRLDNNTPFIDGVGPKPPGAKFYPEDMTGQQFDDALESNPDLGSLYTMVRRGEGGELVAVPYHEVFEEHFAAAAAKLREAAELADDEGFRTYLTLRANALETGSYRESDMAWMDMKDNTLDIVIGPIETYEDALLGRKAAAEAYVLVKDKAWSDRLSRFAQLLPDLQRGLPVDDAYKTMEPGTDSDLNAYDAIFYAGDCNAGSKTIAINLPNDETVQQEKGSRRLQLKNAMQAKFEKILVPISEVLIADSLREHVTFDAFFGNTMFHEVAHGLGIKETITDKGTVREALGNHASALEEGKADILGLYMVSSLTESGELEDNDLRDNYVTFLAGIFRSVRFGASSAHGRANMIRFNFFQEMGAFSRDDDSGQYYVNREKIKQATDALSERILRLQGDGDYEAVQEFVDKYGTVGDQLQRDLDRLDREGIPVDIVFEQGMSVLQ